MLPQDNFSFSCLSRPILGHSESVLGLLHEDNIANNANWGASMVIRLCANCIYMMDVRHVHIIYCIAAARNVLDCKSLPYV